MNLLAAMREIGVRRYILQASGFWYAAGQGLADESSSLALDASPAVAASVRTYLELESTAFRTIGYRLRHDALWILLRTGTWYTNDR